MPLFYRGHQRLRVVAFGDPTENQTMWHYFLDSILLDNYRRESTSMELDRKGTYLQEDDCVGKEAAAATETCEPFLQSE